MAFLLAPNLVTAEKIPKSYYTLITDTAFFSLENGNRDVQINVNNDPQGYLISHSSYNSVNYPRNIDSSITLTGLTPNHQVVINFSGFGMYSHGASTICVKDYLDITGSKTSSSFCGGPGRSPALGRDIILTVKVNQIKLQFVTNNTPGTEGKGFKLKYDGESLIMKNNHSEFSTICSPCLAFHWHVPVGWWVFA